MLSSTSSAELSDCHHHGGLAQEEYFSCCQTYNLNRPTFEPQKKIPFYDWMAFPPCRRRARVAASQDAEVERQIAATGNDPHCSERPVKEGGGLPHQEAGRKDGHDLGTKFTPGVDLADAQDEERSVMPDQVQEDVSLGVDTSAGAESAGGQIRQGGAAQLRDALMLPHVVHVSPDGRKVSLLSMGTALFQID